MQHRQHRKAAKAARGSLLGQHRCMRSDDVTRDLQAAATRELRARDEV